VIVAAGALVLALGAPAAAIDLGGTTSPTALQQLIDAGYDATESAELLEQGYTVEEVKRILDDRDRSSGGTGGGGTVEETTQRAKETVSSTTGAVEETVERTTSPPSSGGSSGSGDSGSTTGDTSGSSGTSGSSSTVSTGTASEAGQSSGLATSRSATGRSLATAPFRVDARAASTTRTRPVAGSGGGGIAAPMVADASDLGMPAGGIEAPLVASAQDRGDDPLIAAAPAVEGPFGDRNLGAEASAAAVLLVLVTAAFVAILGPDRAKRLIRG
jgi:hypothetical protein